VRRHVQKQTGNLFAEFDESTRRDILSQLEELDADAREKEAAKSLITPHEKEEQQILLQENEEEEVETLSTPQEVEEEPQTENSTENEKEQQDISEADIEDVMDERMTLRQLTDEEKELFSSFIHTRKAKEQFIKSIDSISMAAYTGNIIITGDDHNETMSLAKNIVREVQMTDSNFSGKVAKISGAAFNKKDVEATLSALEEICHGF